MRQTSHPTVTGRDRAALLVIAALAVTVPLSLETHLEQVLRESVEPTLSRTAGVSISLATADVDLAGTARLAGVRVGRLLDARLMTATVDTGALLVGQVRPSEVTIDGAQVTLQLRADGGSDAEDLMRRLTRRPATSPGKARRARRARQHAVASLPAVHLTDSDLRVTFPGGEVDVAAIEMHPHGALHRLSWGETTAAARGRGFDVHAGFGRGAVDLDLARRRVERTAVVGGRIEVTHATGAVVADEVALLAGVGQDDGPRLVGRIGADPVSLALDRDAAGTLHATLSGAGMPLAPLASVVGWIAPRGAFAGRVSATWIPASRELLLDGDVQIEEAAIEHGLLASSALPVSGAFTFSAQLADRERSGSVTISGRAGLTPISAAAELRWDEAHHIVAGTLDAEVPESSCADALASVPASLRQPLDGMLLSGQIAARAHVAFDRGFEEPTELDINIDNRCRVEREPTHADAAGLLGRYTHKYPGGARIMALGGADYVPLTQVPAHVVYAFLAAEDARFFQHNGFDLDQIRRSFEINVVKNRVERGGSTISQQLAKNLFLTPERTIGRKLAEAVLTWRIESRVPKSRMFELYVNLVQLGENIYGIGPAAWHWFGKRPFELTVAEAAFIASLAPAPATSDRRVHERGSMDAETERRYRAVLGSMRVHGMARPDIVAWALRQRLAFRRRTT